MRLNLILLICFLLPAIAYPQCKSNQVILLKNQQQNKAAILQKRHPVEIITPYQTFTGRITCIYPKAIEVEGSTIPLADIEVIISRKHKPKPQDFLAMPMIYVGYGLGIVGSIMVGSGVNFGDEDYDAVPLLAGLGALIGSAVLLYTGYSLKSSKTPEEDTIYGLDNWQAEVTDKELARKKIR